MKFDTELHFRLEKATYQAFKEVATQKGLTCGNLCRILVKNYLIKKGKIKDEISASNLQ